MKNLEFLNLQHAKPQASRPNDPATEVDQEAEDAKEAAECTSLRESKLCSHATLPESCNWMG